MIVIGGVQWTYRIQRGEYRALHVLKSGSLDECVYRMCVVHPKGRSEREQDCQSERLTGKLSYLLPIVIVFICLEKLLKFCSSC